MTKFSTMNQKELTGKKTVFREIVSTDAIKETTTQPKEYDNVKFLWKDEEYGDVFVAWDNGYEENRAIFFGEKGDEFNQ